MIKKCVVCEKEFDAKGRDKTCSYECRKAKYTAYIKAYIQSPKGKAYRESTKYKDLRKAYIQSPKYKALQKDYRQRPQNKAKQKVYQMTCDENKRLEKEVSIALQIMSFSL
jgi:hypothetical protein